MMKVLLLQYKHYTEVVFPMLAEEFKWSVLFQNQFDRIVAKLVGSKSYRLTRDQLKDAINFCKMIEDNPTKMKDYEVLAK